jgi:hypothetical protein
VAYPIFKIIDRVRSSFTTQLKFRKKETAWFFAMNVKANFEWRELSLGARAVSRASLSRKALK